MNVVIGNKTFQKPKRALELFKAGFISDEHLKGSLPLLPPIKRYLSFVHNYVGGGNTTLNTRDKLIRLAAGLCNSAYFDKGGSATYHGIISLARFSDYWIRPPEDFRPKTYNTNRIINSFFEHLFVKYRIPTFFFNVLSDTVNYNHASGETEKDLIILSEILIGQGVSVRDKRIHLPLKLTAAMSHHFLQSDVHHTYNAACRRAQVIGVGGSERLAWYINDSKLGRTFTNDDFWLTVIAWFARQGMFDYNQIGPMIDYIDYVRTHVEQKPNGTWAPINPDFQVKGRTIQSVLAATEKWHKDLAVVKNTRAEHKFWEPCDIPNYYADSKSFEFEVVQLVTAAQLREEGSDMSHCVGSYASSCAEKRIAIFSGRQRNKGTHEKTNLITIEVQLSSRQVVQARGKCNVRPTPQAEQLLNAFKNTLIRTTKI